MEQVLSTVNKGDTLIVHYGNPKLQGTRFIVYTRSMAREMRDTLNKFLGE